MDSIKRLIKEMSLSKKLGLKSDSLKKQSFGYRICDDLSEIILQFLPFNDKIRYESVSKQFQKTILQKHEELNFKEFISIDGNIDLIAFESVLKKCPNVRSVCLIDLNTSWHDTFESTSVEYHQMIGMVIKYCHNLETIVCNFGSICDQFFERFVQKFGSKLRSFLVISDSELKFAERFVNLRELVFCDHRVRLSHSNKFSCAVRVCLKDSRILSFGFSSKLQTLIESNSRLKRLSIEWFDCDFI